MSIVLQGSTSGSVTLQEPAVAGSTVLTLPAVSGTVLTTTSPKAGNVLQVVQATYSTVASTTSGTFQDTGLSASITPTSSSSKILVLTSMYYQSYVTSGNARDTGGSFRFVRASTNIWTPTNVTAYIDGGTGATLSFVPVNVWNLSYLDNPATTSATTYKVQFYAISGSTMSINPGGSNAPSTITLMEIAA